MDTINWFSMFLATITPVLVGSVYFHKNLCGKVFNSQNYTTGKLRSKTQTVIILAVSLPLSFLLSFFLLEFNNGGISQEGYHDTFLHGVWHGVFIAITTVSPVIVINAFFGKQNWKIISVLILYWIITLALMGGILDAMNHWENIVIPG